MSTETLPCPPDFYGVAAVEEIAVEHIDMSAFFVAELCNVIDACESIIQPCQFMMETHGQFCYIVCAVLFDKTFTVVCIKYVFYP